MDKFAIKLDRPSATYYAGEVITGSVTIHCNGETCRSILLTCAGKARVHWHTGGGDNRNDYDGVKYFMENKRTLYGNFYKTTILDNAGDHAYFGGAFGDGDMVRTMNNIYYACMIPVSMGVCSFCKFSFVRILSTLFHFCYSFSTSHVVKEKEPMVEK
jgi:hypothetical protein